MGSPFFFRHFIGTFDNSRVTFSRDDIVSFDEEGGGGVLDGIGMRHSPQKMRHC